MKPQTNDCFPEVVQINDTYADLNLKSFLELIYEPRFCRNIAKDYQPGLHEMEYILARELELEKKLKQIENRKKSLVKSKSYVNLATVKTPADLGAVAQERRANAQERNSKLLQDLDIEIGKLHTRRLCPIHERLAEQKAKFFRDIYSFQLQSQHYHE